MMKLFKKGKSMSKEWNELMRKKGYPEFKENKNMGTRVIFIPRKSDTQKSKDSDGD